MIINGPNISKRDSQTLCASWCRYALPLQKYSLKKQNKVTTKNITHKQTNQKNPGYDHDFTANFQIRGNTKGRRKWRIPSYGGN